MLVKHVDFNGAKELIEGPFAQHWKTLEQVLRNMPLHVKASDEALP